MAEFRKFNAEEQAAFDQWVAERPPSIQAMIAKCPPNRLFCNKGAGNQRVTILSYEENNTVTVAVTAQFNRVMFERNVFGVPIDNLEECDLPDESEPVGAVLTEAGQIDSFIELTRPAILEMRDQNNRG